MLKRFKEPHDIRQTTPSGIHPHLTIDFAATTITKAA